MISLKLGSNANKKLDYIVSVPVEIIPASVNYSQCSVTQHENKDKDLGLLLTEEEYASIPVEDRLQEKISSGIIASPVYVFDPRQYFKSADSDTSMISYHAGDTAATVTAAMTLTTSLNVTHETSTADAENAVVPVKWVSSDPAVISISDAGVVTVTRPEASVPDSQLEVDASNNVGKSVTLTASIDMSEATIDGVAEEYEAVKKWKASKSFVVKVLRAEAPAPEGGSPEGGSPEGGSPEGGSPEGGSPEGGSPEGGSPEGGSSEGGEPVNA